MEKDRRPLTSFLLCLLCRLALLSFLWRKNRFNKNKAPWLCLSCDWLTHGPDKITSSHPTNDPIDADAEGAVHVRIEITVDIDSSFMNFSLPVWSSALYPQPRCVVVRLVFVPPSPLLIIHGKWVSAQIFFFPTSENWICNIQHQSKVWSHFSIQMNKKWVQALDFYCTL